MTSSEIFAKRGWLEMETGTGQKYYLVKNKMLLVPDKELPKVTPKDLERLKGLDEDEKNILIEALGIFKGSLV
mgnify:CR=1 FL=1|jgi:hypothetical protein